MPLHSVGSFTYWELQITSSTGQRAMYLIESPTGNAAIRRLLDEVPDKVFTVLTIDRRNFEGVFLQ